MRKHRNGCVQIREHDVCMKSAQVRNGELAQVEGLRSLWKKVWHDTDSSAAVYDRWDGLLYPLLYRSASCAKIRTASVE